MISAKRIKAIAEAMRLLAAEDASNPEEKLYWGTRQGVKTPRWKKVAAAAHMGEDSEDVRTTWDYVASKASTQGMPMLAMIEAWCEAALQQQTKRPDMQFPPLALVQKCPVSIGPIPAAASFGAA